MRAMPIKVDSDGEGLTRLLASFKKNWKHYIQEGIGLGIFMVSACFFSALFWGNHEALHIRFPNETIKNVINAMLMGSTALFIFYSPFTAPSGSQINPAVTITFLRLNRICRFDALFYIIFQFLGGLLAVYLMAAILGNSLTASPVRYAITKPGSYGVAAAALMELAIAVLMMLAVLLTSDHQFLRKHTRIIASCLVCIDVIFAGPVSGFGMNPARSFASAFPAHIYTAFWIYMLLPCMGMLSAAEIYLFIKRKRIAPGKDFEGKKESGSIHRNICI
jgi:aquaporin Z